MARKYTKKSPYWDNRKSLKSALDVAMNRSVYPRLDKPYAGSPTISYEFGGEAMAALNQSYQDSVSPEIELVNRFRNLNAASLPWEYTSNNSYLSITNAMLLCQRAYANVAIFRNAIEGAVEFSNSPLHIKTENQTVKAFFTEWFSRVNMYKVKDNWFRGYYREGNDFAMRFMGRIESAKYAKMQSVFGSKSPIIPIRYTFLNPTQVYLTSGVSYANNYVKMLSQYEILRLKNPVTPEDKQVFDSLPDDVKANIKGGRSGQSVFMPLDPKRLICSFYKKQDYEPLALPMGYPLLNDIEYKLELKKMDMSLSRTIEHVLLLVTTGEKAEEWGGGGVNPQNVANLQSIFRNQTLGRVLVADYTTKAEWKIPDIGEILGPQKYEQVEKDIREGLQSIFVGGEDKFANASMKAKIFTERLKEGQKVFLNQFLLPEIRMICEAMNFRDVPEIEFEQINLDDSSQRERVLLRLAELGILTPDEIITGLESGILPDKKSNLRSQEEYKTLREKNLYQPLIGGGQQDGGDGRPVGSGGTKKATVKPGQIGVTKAAVVAEKLAAVSIQGDRLVEKIEDTFKKKRKLKELPDSMKEIAVSLAKAIIANEPQSEWTKVLPQYLQHPKEMNAETAAAVNEAAIEFDVDEWKALLIVKSKQ